MLTRPVRDGASACQVGEVALEEAAAESRRKDAKLSSPQVSAWAARLTARMSALRAARALRSAMSSAAFLDGAPWPASA
eukprot:9487729-Pyramimonas_sp.AAC.1